MGRNADNCCSINFCASYLTVAMQLVAMPRKELPHVHFITTWRPGHYYSKAAKPQFLVMS